MSTATPIGWLARSQALPWKFGPTQSFGSNWNVSPGASVKISQMRARRQSSCSLNQISTLEHSSPPFWMYMNEFHSGLLSAYRQRHVVRVPTEHRVVQTKVRCRRYRCTSTVTSTPGVYIARAVSQHVHREEPALSPGPCGMPAKARPSLYAFLKRR
jgi:hypothetical protein